MTARLQIIGLHKSFSTPVLQGVSLTFKIGEVHALVGENGAGKSTMMNILSGLLPLDQGQLLLDGAEYSPQKPRHAFQAGISFAAQELSLIPTLSVAENIGLRDLSSHQKSLFPSIDRKTLVADANQLLHRVGLEHIDPETTTERLNLSEQQLVEIAKALSTTTVLSTARKLPSASSTDCQSETAASHRCRLLILDEPTAALTGPQADHLHKIIRELADQGTTIIYISHRLEDVLAVSDCISVLRDGQVVITAAAQELSVKEMITHMSGRKSLDHQPSRSKQLGDIAIDIENACTQDLPNPVKLKCYQGEILGIDGLAGSGRTELLSAIYGVSSPRSGRILCRDRNGSMIPIKSPGHAVKCGIGYLPEERKTDGILAALPVSANISLPVLNTISSSFGRINFPAEREAATALIADLAIKCDGPDQAIERLSGGNQQKCLLGRWIFAESDIFLLDEPTRGIDVGAKDRIYQKLHQLRDQGKCILVASSELEELTALCDRIAVMSNRKLVRVFTRDEWNHDEILQAAFSEYNEAKTA